MKTILVALILFVTGAAVAQDFPRRPVRFVVPYAPGAINDAVGRTLAQRLTEIWPHPTIVDNRSGGGSIVGTEIVARSQPDGHTLLLTSIAHAITPAMHKKLPYDVMRDFAYVTQVGYGPFLLVVYPGLGADSVKSLVALAKAKPGQIIYGSSGVGAGAHLATELFKSMAGINLVHVPYKGGGPAIIDLLAGQVQLTFATQVAVGGHLKAGKLRALAVSSAKRARVLPELPTMAEACCPGYDAAPSWGVAVPAATPKATVDRLHSAIVGVLRQPEIIERYAAQSVELVTGTPAEETARMQSELARWARAVKDSGAKID
jgi:tripartite-type tricarboxylate transporter receptor subunit TctC